MWVATRRPAAERRASFLPAIESHSASRRARRSRLRREMRAVYADDVGRTGLPPDRYFRMLLLGYFGDLDSERGTAWRAADSLSIASTARADACTTSSSSLARRFARWRRTRPAEPAINIGPSGFSVGKRVERCHDRATASRASRAMRGAFGAPLDPASRLRPEASIASKLALAGLPANVD
jgi:hypothetical protein